MQKPKSLSSDSPCEKVDDIVARHRATTEKKIATLKKLRRELCNTLAACSDSMRRAQAGAPMM